MMKHTIGYVCTELNAPKGIWCEICGNDCSNEHLIRITSMKLSGVHGPVCFQCAKDLMACLKLSLMDALLIEKE